MLLRGLNQADQALRGLEQRLHAARRAAPRSARFPAPPDPPGPAAAAFSDPSALTAPLRILRPPGAARGERFDQTCTRSGQCVTVCPAQAIRLDPQQAGGLPFIIARQAPCVVCTDLSCMKACPSGALTLVESARHIRMGLAEVDHARCLRGPDGAGDDCQLCVSHCPIGDDALTVDAAGLVRVGTDCTGCGVCERVCPTEPASIIVQPGEGQRLV